MEEMGKRRPERQMSKKQLPFVMGNLTDWMIKQAEDELNETEERKEKALEELRQIIRDVRNIYCRMDDNFLLQFLRVKKFDVHNAFKVIQNYFNFRKRFRHLMDLEDNSPVHVILRMNFVGFLPHRDEFGRPIFVMKVGLWDPEVVNRDYLVWTITHCVLFSIEDPASQITGYSAIFDCRGISKKHLLQITPENIRLTMHSITSVFPGRYKSGHFIFDSKIFKIIWPIIYPFLSEKLRSRIWLHGTDFKSLHKHFSPSILPSEFGGTQGPFDNSAFVAQVIKGTEWIIQMGRYGYQ